MRDMRPSKDNHGRMYIPGVNCCVCGRFIGKDGNVDVSYDWWTDGYELGYPTCGKCIAANGDSAKEEE
jgi:homoaconitase/3-isopropylmalate dehydratase large subunit